MKNKMKIKLLFVCSGGLDRSPCAEALFKESKKYEAKSCGIYPLISAQLTKEMLKWADEIFVMEPDHKSFILENFPLIIQGKPEILILDIPNNYVRTDPELEKILRIKLKDYLEK